MSLFDVIIGLSAGLTAGCINTLAGNGSALTLAILMEFFGLPPNVANATNRIGVLAQSTASSVSFYQSKVLNVRQQAPILIFTLIGSIIGITLALIISGEQFKIVYQYLLIVMLVIIMIKPKRWIKAQEIEEKNLSPMIANTLYLLLGVYGGFIQMGMGIFALALFVLVGRMNIIKANAIKSFVIAVYTLVALGVFAWQGLIHWPFGLVLGLGQMVGGFVTAKFAAHSPVAGKVAYYLLILCVILAILRVFGWI